MLAVDTQKWVRFTVKESYEYDVEREKSKARDSAYCTTPVKKRKNESRLGISKLFL